MRIPGLDIDRKKAVVIPGAGASRGAKCFTDSLFPPPLDTDFFSLLERVQHRDHALRRMLESVKEEFGETSFPRMEELFTQIEALSDFHDSLKIRRGSRVTRYDKQLNSFVSNIARYFRIVFKDPSSGAHVACDHHDRLAELLHAEDVVITFNYDCLIDEALRRNAGSTWDPQRSYGFPITTKGCEAWRSLRRRGRPPRNPIALLKLHGSLNWDRSAGVEAADLTLREDPYTFKGRTAAEVVPPVWDKTIRADSVLEQIWKEARRSLPTGPVLIVVGYSVPQTDLLSQALIRVAVAERAENKKLSHLIVCNPDTTARRRLVELVHGGMNSATSVVELRDLNELSKLLM